MQRLLPAICLGFTLAMPLCATGAPAYDGYRWFFIELSIFSNEFPEYRDAEHWSADRLQLQYPARIRDFARLGDFFRLSDFAAQLSQEQDIAGRRSRDVADRETANREYLAGVGPFPMSSPGDIRLPDLERTPYLLLPQSLSDFQTTNTRLERAPEHRLLFHGLWRQPVLHTSEASALLIQGGGRFGEHHELEGSITIRFNANEDRVVIDANLWLTEFTALPTGEMDWELPALPSALASSVAPDPFRQPDQYGISRIVQMRQSRDMRSNEFHYLDHPALGIVINVMPYDLPPPGQLRTPDLETDVDGIASPVPGID